ncbi:HAD family hydrolase [Amycolatopsis sp. cmx-4-68]|uniref:HAD family hydrolase n=1 Tax=Amycolatopsis sp. cmx-4-68 TaxID=2790938 RepID=UPI003977F372
MPPVNTSSGAVKAVTVDVGGVLLLPAPRLIGPAIGDVTGVQPSARLLHRAHYAATAATGGAGGPLSIAYRRRFAEVCGVPPERAEDAAAGLERALRAPDCWTEPAAGGADALARLHDGGWALAVVSNAAGRTAGQLADAGLGQVGPGPATPLAAIVDSHLFGVRKPDPRIFRHALDLLGVTPVEAVHVGDDPWTDVGGAEAAGIRPVHVDPYRDCGAEGHAHVTDLAGVLDLLAVCDQPHRGNTVVSPPSGGGDLAQG